ncbi:MAG: histidine phosphatase family protein [Actinobacteria bacterium]|nr:histidine phosphatase family protein [Actinomycetota bacterium]
MMDTNGQQCSRLVLVRHAKSDYPWGVVDHARPLNERGRRDAPELGAWLDTHISWEEGRPPVVRISTARRAQLTWGLAHTRLSDRWDAADVADEPRIYEASVSTLLDVIGSVPQDTGTLILVGHNPGLADVVLALSRADEMRAAATVKFPTSAVAVLESYLSLPLAVGQNRAFRVVDFAVPRG